MCDYQLGARLCVSDGVLGETLIHAVVRVEQSENFEVVTVDDLEVLAGNEDIAVLDPSHRGLRHSMDVALELHFTLRVCVLVTRALPECRGHCRQEMAPKSKLWGAVVMPKRAPDCQSRGRWFKPTYRSFRNVGNFIHLTFACVFRKRH